MDRRSRKDPLPIGWETAGEYCTSDNSRIIDQSHCPAQLQRSDIFVVRIQKLNPKLHRSGICRSYGPGESLAGPCYKYVAPTVLHWSLSVCRKDSVKMPPLTTWGDRDLRIQPVSSGISPLFGVFYQAGCRREYRMVCPRLSPLPPRRADLSGRHPFSPVVFPCLMGKKIEMKDCRLVWFGSKL